MYGGQNVRHLKKRETKEIGSFLVREYHLSLASLVDYVGYPTDLVVMS